MGLTDHYTIICPHCGCDTGVDPALVDPEAPMIYCPDCDGPLFEDHEIED